MGNKKQKPRDIRNEQRREAKEKFKKQQEQQEQTYKQSLIVEVLPEKQEPEQQFGEVDLEYVEIASTQPLELADSISRTNNGRKFRNLSQWERYNRLRESFKTISLRLLRETDLRGKELDEAVIKEMLKDENLSREDREILQNKLPGNER